MLITSSYAPRIIRTVPLLKMHVMVYGPSIGQYVVLLVHLLVSQLTVGLQIDNCEVFAFYFPLRFFRSDELNHIPINYCLLTKIMSIPKTNCAGEYGRLDGTVDRIDHDMAIKEIRTFESDHSKLITSCKLYSFN